MTNHFEKNDINSFDFSKESHIYHSLLSKIKSECFGELSEDQLELISAAGSPNNPNAVKDPHF